MSGTVTTGLRLRSSLFASHAAAVPHCAHVAAATLARPSTGASAVEPGRLEEAQAAQKARHAARAPSRRLAAHSCGDAGGSLLRVTPGNVVTGVSAPAVKWWWRRT